MNDPGPGKRHLAEKRWFRLSNDTIVEYRATFYEKYVAWEDHPWGREDDGIPGAGFQNHWAIEKRYHRNQPFYPCGRSNDGFDALTRQSGPCVFDTYQDAADQLLKNVKKRIKFLEEEARELREKFELEDVAL